MSFNYYYAICKQVLKYQVENEINIMKSEGNMNRKSISLEDTLPAKVNMEDENEQ